MSDVSALVSTRGSVQASNPPRFPSTLHRTRRGIVSLSETFAQSIDPEIAPQDFARIYIYTPSLPISGNSDAGVAPNIARPDRPILLDVREPWEFEAASLPGALQMPMGDVTSRAHAELDPDAHIVVLCHHGQRSLSVAMWLRGQGFDRAQSLAGGIDAWSRSMDPAVPRY
jgi:rhodanese-related sulfurtransferase